MVPLEVAAGLHEESETAFKVRFVHLLQANDVGVVCQELAMDQGETVVWFEVGQGALAEENGASTLRGAVHVREDVVTDQPEGVVVFPSVGYSCRSLVEPQEEKRRNRGYYR